MNHAIMMTYGMIKDRLGKDVDKSRTRSATLRERVLIFCSLEPINEMVTGLQRGSGTP